VIVKKIATSPKSPPKSKAANVRALADYIAGPRAGGAGEKVEHRGALNLLNIDHACQVQEMIDLAETAKRSPNPVQHWILSWRENEQPTAAQADEAVRMFLGELGLAEHQALYALHRNTDIWHVHVAVNRVNPETEKLVTVNKGFDHEVAHRAIARIEQLQGWEPVSHPLYDVHPDGQIERARPRGEGERRPSGRALDFEERAGERSAERIAIEDAAPLIRRARGWPELHAALAPKGMRFEKKGSGALLWVGDQAVKASAAGRECSMSALQKRLGEYMPGPAVTTPRSVRRPLEPESPLAGMYAEKRRKHYEERVAARAQNIDKQREEVRRVADRHRQERADIFRGSWKGKGALLNALRSTLAARQAAEKAELRDRHKLERAVLRRDKGRFPSCPEWLSRFESHYDEEWRHRERRPSTLEGPKFDPPAARDIRAFSAMIDGGRVHYYRAGSRDAPAFTDRGKTIDIHDSRRRENVLAALQLSAQKWGTITVRGDERFKRTCVELAAEHGFKISNPNLQQAIAAERERLRQTQRPPARPQPESMTQAAIYRRHLAEIVREHPHRRADPSRLDAEVAVRMAVTGHSREQIATAIKEGASGDRASEKRDWDQYALRATSYAFSPPGQEMRDRLAGRRDDLTRLEGRQDELDLLRGLGGPMRYI
jgi:relaxase-like protein/conjugative element/phage-associated large polyvalent protein/DNA relaxase TraI-like protein/DNA primase RepB-like protein